MRFWGLVILVCFVESGAAFADDVLYRYEGNVLPYDESAGWEVFNPCESPCSESLENGHFVLLWPRAGDLANYHLWIARQPDAPPSSLWVEWRFRSDLPIPTNFFTCDANFKVKYGEIFELVFIYGDAVISFSGDDFVWQLENGEFRTYRFESPDGVNFRFSVDGLIFKTGRDTGTIDSSFLQLAGQGGCTSDQIPNMVNEWDFVRYGTMSCGERLAASDPPAGFLDSNVFGGLDRFTISYDSANYIYLNEVSVETTAGVAPVVTKIRRLENGAPETVEIVLDRPLPPGEHTRFIFDDGTIQNIIDYSFIPGDADGNGALDLREVATFQNCFGSSASNGACLAFDQDASGVIDANDIAPFSTSLNGPRE